MLYSASNTSGIIIGGLAALVAAALWSVGTFIYGRVGTDVPPMELNLVKCILAILLMVITSLFLGEKVPHAAALPYILLVCSGIIGIGLGDTAYFESLNRLGAKLALLLTVLAPPIAGIISWIFLGEALKPISWLGIVITLAGVAWVIWEEQKGNQSSPKGMWIGIGFGVLACLTQAIGATFSRYALTESTISALQTAIIRLTAGLISLIPLILFSKNAKFVWIKSRNSGSQGILKLLGLIFLGGFMGSFLGIWLQQVALQNAPVGISQTLLSTSPIFILPIAALRGEKVTWKSILGVLIAIAGVVILFGFS
jgi:drug/metabolite transporter (DMT)-like permease